MRITADLNNWRNSLPPTWIAGRSDSWRRHRARCGDVVPSRRAAGSGSSRKFETPHREPCRPGHPPPMPWWIACHCQCQSKAFAWRRFNPQRRGLSRRSMCLEMMANGSSRIQKYVATGVGCQAAGPKTAGFVNKSWPWRRKERLLASRKQVSHHCPSRVM